MNALAVGTTLALLTAGAFAIVWALRSPGPPEPIGAPSSMHSTPKLSAPAACTSVQLRAVGSMEGAAGSREGAIGLKNVSDETCTLRGTPTITLVDRNLEPITSGVIFGTSPPGWMIDRLPEPRGWPIVTLEPGDSASVRVRWSNWCPDGRAAPLWRVEIPAGGTVGVNGLDGEVNGLEGNIGPPPCNGPGQPSTIDVAPFEPHTGA